MKKIISLLLVLTLLLPAAGCLAESPDLKALSLDQLRLLQDRVAAEISQRLAEDRAREDYILFGDIGFRYIGYEVQDYYNEGEKKLFFDFEWKNFGEKPKCYLWNLEFKAFQDGIQVNEMAMDNLIITEQSRTHYETEVMPGYSIRAAAYFVIKSDSPVTVYVRRYGSEDLIFVIDPLAAPQQQ